MIAEQNAYDFCGNSFGLCESYVFDLDIDMT
jgi:hypothetical protein